MDARGIISLWPSRRAIAADTGRSMATIHSWWNRNSIPGDVDVVLVHAAFHRGFKLTFEDLARSRAGEAAQDRIAALGGTLGDTPPEAA